MDVVFSPQAQEDLRLAREYIAQDSPTAADRVLERVTRVIEMLASGLVEGREVQLRDGRRVHTWPVYPYRIYYRRKGKVLEVVRVYHQVRRPIERS
jgi:addiction module RelE/StbE family toxin